MNSNSKEEKKLSIIDELHSNLWANVRNWQSNIVQYLLVLISIIGIEISGLYYNDGEFLFYTTVASQIALIWILFVIMESAHQYRVFQRISANIERDHAGGLKGILPTSFINPKHNLPEIYWIHFALFYIYLIFVSILYFCRGKDKTCWNCAIIAVILFIGLVLPHIYFSCCRGRKFDRLIESTKPNNQDKKI